MFNNRLLQGLNPKDRVLAKLILFTQEEGINLISFLEEKGIVSRTHTVLSQLWQNGALLEDLSSNNGSLTLREPLYIEEDSVPEFEVDRLRQFWSNRNIGSAGKLSYKSRVQTLLVNWFIDNPGHTFEQVVTAGKMYIDNCLSENRLIMDVDNFIFNGEKSTLSTWISKLLEEETTTQYDSRSRAI